MSRYDRILEERWPVVEGGPGSGPHGGAGGTSPNKLSADAHEATRQTGDKEAEKHSWAAAASSAAGDSPTAAVLHRKAAEMHENAAKSHEAQSDAANKSGNSRDAQKHISLMHQHGNAAQAHDVASRAQPPTTVRTGRPDRIAPSRCSIRENGNARSPMQKLTSVEVS